MDIAAEIIRQAGLMRGDRAPYEPRWQDIRNYLQPLMPSFTTTDVSGQSRRTEILDNSGETFSQLLVAALDGFLTNPTTEWHVVRAKRRDVNEIASVKRYLAGANETMRYVFDTPDSGFSTELTQDYHEMVDFGTSCMFIGDRPSRLPIFQTRNLSELLLRENSEGRIDTVFREFRLTARQAVQEWKNDNLSTKTRELAVSNPGQKLGFIHAVYPNSDTWPGARHSTNLPFASKFVAVDEKLFIKSSGYHENPFIVGRWWKVAGEIFGRGPGLKALHDVKMLQRAMRITIRGTEKMVDPAMMVANDGVLGPTRLSNNGINYIRPDMLMGRRAPIEAIQTGGRPDLGAAFMEGVRARIGHAYYSHLLQMSRDPKMTATQSLLIDEEVMRLLGPFFRRIQVEKLGPTIVRTWNTLERAGEFGPRPAELEGERLEVQHVSPAVRAMRLGEVNATARLFEIMRPMAEIEPESVDNIDIDATYRHTADRLGVPFGNIRTPEAIAERREARAEAQQVEKQRQDAVEAAAALQSLSQAGASAGGAVNAPVQ